MRTVMSTFAIVPVLVLAACAGRQAEYGPSDPDARTILEVDNQSSLDMNIYVIREAGDRTRLGTATAHVRSRFTIPSRLMFGITSLRFQADPVGSRRAPISQSINVTAGETVVLTIPPF
ncbi:MAG: hypothetical protein PVI57_20300 [Gemmatimonadota bacterium]|jgi:hypothetical protein